MSHARMMLWITLASCAAPPGPVAMATVPPRPADVATIDGLMAAFYEVVNVAPHEPRQWARDRTLYSPHVRFIAIDGDGRAQVWTHQEFVDSTEPLIAQGFAEREIFRTARRYGNMVHIDSTYETRRGPGGRDRSRGVNSVEAYHDGARWWIAGVIWQSESARFPIPPSLLPPEPEPEPEPAP